MPEFLRPYADTPIMDEILTAFSYSRSFSLSLGLSLSVPLSLGLSHSLSFFLHSYLLPILPPIYLDYHFCPSLYLYLSSSQITYLLTYLLTTSLSYVYPLCLSIYLTLSNYQSINPVSTYPHELNYLSLSAFVCLSVSLCL